MTIAIYSQILHFLFIIFQKARRNLEYNRTDGAFGASPIHTDCTKPILSKAVNEEHIVRKRKRFRVFCI